jgi:hypothetical protein
MTPEGITKALIKKYFKVNDIWYVMVTPSAFGASTGISDFQCLKKSVFFVVEAKRGDKPAEATANQLDYMKKVVDNGGLAFLVRNQEDIDNMDKVLRERGVV